MIHITINTSHAAFEDGLTQEILRILNEINFIDLPKKLRDINGNVVGEVNYVNNAEIDITTILNKISYHTVKGSSIEELKESLKKFYDQYNT